MARWIPLMASVGLVSLMILPAPGIWGLLIGVVCSLAIVVSAFLWLFDKIAARLAEVWERRDRRRRRAMHSGSGMMRKAGAPPSAPAEPPRPSPLEERARIAALRRTARRQDPFRVR